MTFLSSSCEFGALDDVHMGPRLRLSVDSTALAEVPTWFGMVFRSVSNGFQRFPAYFSRQIEENHDISLIHFHLKCCTNSGPKDQLQLRTVTVGFCGAISLENPGC